MRIVLFCHSLLSDWNHGNAHFLRGVVTELATRGHDVHVYEPRDAWSVVNLVQDHGRDALQAVTRKYPHIRPHRYVPAELDLDRALEGAHLVIVHEWNDHDLVARIGVHRASGRGRYRVLFHDTHHRSITDEAAMSAYDLSGYDGVLAFGSAIREVYARKGWARRAFVWHEAADVRVFRPKSAGDGDGEVVGDVVWVGNWGDGERTNELRDLLFEPVRDEGLRARVYGVRYPDAALAQLAEHGIEYAGWLPNYRVPEVFGSFLMTIHVPRRPYVEALPGIPTIRVFEALACGIALVSTPWEDSENLFTPGADYLIARDAQEMRRHMRTLASEPDARKELAAHGLRTLLSRHTTAHRVDELLAIARDLGAREAPRTKEARS